MIRIALPNKGRLRADALDLLERAGLPLASPSDRTLIAPLGDDFTALFVRTQDIPEFVADGAADVGVTGHDVVQEAGRDLQELLDLRFGRCRLVLAARQDAAYANAAGLLDGARIATSFPRMAQRYFAGIGKRFSLVPVSGAAEIAPHLGVADAIVDLVSTGSTLQMNGLVEVETILESSARLIGRCEEAPAAQARKLHELVTSLESVLRAEGQRYLMANVKRCTLDRIKEILPGISGPTIVNVLDHGDFVAAHAVVPQRDVFRVIAELKDAGAEGILVTRIERLLP